MSLYANQLPNIPIKGHCKEICLSGIWNIHDQPYHWRTTGPPGLYTHIEGEATPVSAVFWGTNLAAGTKSISRTADICASFSCVAFLNVININVWEGQGLCMYRLFLCTSHKIENFQSSAAHPYIPLSVFSHILVPHILIIFFSCIFRCFIRLFLFMFSFCYLKDWWTDWQTDE